MIENSDRRMRRQSVRRENQGQSAIQREREFCLSTALGSLNLSLATVDKASCFLRNYRFSRNNVDPGQTRKSFTPLGDTKLIKMNPLFSEDNPIILYGFRILRIRLYPYNYGYNTPVKVKSFEIYDCISFSHNTSNKSFVLLNSHSFKSEIIDL